MKVNIIATLLLSLTAIPALATGNSNNNDTYNTTNNNQTYNQGGNASANASAGALAATSLKSNIEVSNRNTNLQGQVQGQQQGQKQSVDNANNASQNTSITGDTYKEARNPVNSAYAPSIVTLQECSKSASGGVSLIGFGISGGATSYDANCLANNEIIMVVNVFKDLPTAEAMKCNASPAYRKARITTGRPCDVEQD